MSCDCTGPRKIGLPEDDERRRFMADPVSRMRFAAARRAVMYDMGQQVFKQPGFT